MDSSNCSQLLMNSSQLFILGILNEVFSNISNSLTVSAEYSIY
jgi:hypothetical protein